MNETKTSAVSRSETKDNINPASLTRRNFDVVITQPSVLEVFV